MLTLIPIVNLVVLVASLLLLLLRKSPNAAADLPATLARVEARGEALDQHLRAELAQMRSDRPSSGWRRRARTFGSNGVVGLRLNSTSGTSLKCTAISDARFGSRLPVRR